jgi:hypothetical protein
MRTRSLPTGLFLCGCAALGAWGCASEGGGDTDFDGDRSPDAVDCDPADPDTYPGAPDPYGDDVDQDCDGYDGIDRDGDGYPANEELAGEEVYDCNDNDSSIHPGAAEIPGDEVDQDCDGLDGFMELAVVIDPAEPGTADELSIVVTSDAESWDIQWLLDDEVQVELAGSETVTAALTREGQLWQVQVTPISAGLLLYGSRDEATVLIHNTPPQLSAVTLAPEQPSELVPLLASSQGLEDADAQDQPSVRYRWFVNEVEVLGWTGEELTGTYFDKGDAIRVEAVPSDGSDDGEGVTSAVVTAANTPPSVASVELFPNPITELSTVNALLLDWADPDPADAAQLSAVVWYVNAAPVSVEEELDGADFDSGDEITAEVTPYDGEDWGTPLLSDPVVVANTPPSLLQVVILPNSPDETSTLTAELVGLQDPDLADVVQLQYAWTVNGVAAGSNATLDGNSFARGDSVGVTVTPYDPLDFGAAVTALPVIVGNSPPTLAAVAISPDPADVTVPFLLATASGFSDPDGDADQTTYEWFVGGVSVATGSQLAPANFARGDLVEVLATPGDGQDQGTPAVASITIANAPPQVFSVQLNPGTGTEATIFTVTGGGFSDPDGDAEGYLYQWYVNTLPVATTATLDGASFDRSNLVSVEITAWDGEAAGNTVSDGPVSILNSGPTLTTVELSPSAVFTDSVVTCTATDAADPDGDPLTTSYTWTVNGLAIAAPDAPTLDGNSGPVPSQNWFARGDEVTCSVEIADGTAAPVSVTSAPITVQNSPPVLAQADIIQQEAYTFTQLSCMASGFADADGDSPSYTWNWYIGGSLAATSTTNNTLDPVLTSRGDTVWCEVVASDGTDPATPTQSASLSIANTPPSAPVLSWSPGLPQAGVALTCVVAADATDPDGDSFTYHWRWFRDGVEDNALDDLDTVPAAEVQTGERWTCRVWADDGNAGPIAEKSVYLFGAGISFPPLIEVSDMQRMPDRTLVSSGYGDPGMGCLGSRCRIIQSLDDPPTGSWMLRDFNNVYFPNYDLTPQSCLSGFSRSGFLIGASRTSVLVDLNGDGLKDLLSWNYAESTGGYNATGRAWVWFQPATGFPSSGNWNTSSADVVISGESDRHYLASGAAVGDINADGYSDLVLTAMHTDGASYLFYGPLPAGTWLASALGVEVATRPSSHWGDRPVVSGDFDGDGYDDLALANGDDSGGLRMVYGRAGPSPQPGTSISVPGHCTYYRHDTAGMAAADFDGDGYDDFICRRESGDQLDYIFLWGGALGLGAHGSTVVDVQATSSAGPPMEKASPVLDDIDGDGAADLLVLMADDTGENRKDGNFALFLGGSRPTSTMTAADAAVVFSGEFANNTDFRFCDIVPDLDGGGIKDIACYADDNYTYVHLVEDTDADGDLFSVLDCDADDGDPNVH